MISKMASRAAAGARAVVWRPCHRRMRSYIVINVNFISNEKATKCYAALTDDPKAITQLNTL